MPSETRTLMKSHGKWAVPKLTVVSSFIDSIPIFIVHISPFIDHIQFFKQFYYFVNFFYTAS